MSLTSYRAAPPRVTRTFPSPHTLLRVHTKLRPSLIAGFAVCETPHRRTSRGSSRILLRVQLCPAHLEAGHTGLVECPSPAAERRQQMSRPIAPIQKAPIHLTRERPAYGGGSA